MGLGRASATTGIAALAFLLAACTTGCRHVDSSRAGAQSDPELASSWDQRAVQEAFGGPFEREMMARLMALQAEDTDLRRRELGRLAATWERVRCTIPASAESVELSADGRLLALCSREGISLWNTETGESIPLARRDVDAEKEWMVGNDMAFSPDGSLLAALSDRGRLQIWRTSDGASLHGPLRLLGPDEQGWAGNLEFHPDGRRLGLTVGSEQMLSEPEIRILDLMSELEVVATFDEGRFAFSPDGSRLAVAEGYLENLSIRVRDLETGAALAPDLPVEQTSDLVFSPDGRLVVADGCGGFRAWTMDDWTPTAVSVAYVERFYRDEYRPDDLSADGRILATRSGRFWSRSYGGVVLLWNTTTGKLAAPPIPFREPVEDVSLSRDGSLLAVGGPLGKTRIYEIDIRSGFDMIPPTTDRPGGNPRDETLPAPRVQKLLTVQLTHSLRHLDWQTGEPVGPAWERVRGGTVRAISPEGSVLHTDATEGDLPWRHTARLWDIGSRSGPVMPLPVFGNDYEATFSFDGRRFATITDDGIVQIWESPGGRSLGPPLQHRERGREEHPSFAIALDRHLLATAGQTLELWDLRETHPVPLERSFDARIRQIAFKPGGAILAAARTDGSLMLLDTRDLSVLGSFEIRATTLAFSRDGRRILTQGWDDRLSMWELEGTSLRHAWTVLDVHMPAFHPGGELLAVVVDEHRIRLLDARDGSTRSEHTPGGTIDALGSDTSGETLVVASSDPRLLDRDSLTGQVIRELDSELLPLPRSWNGRWGFLHGVLWDLASGERVDADLPPGQRWLSPDASLVAIRGYRDDEVRLWSLAERAFVGPRLTQLDESGRDRVAHVLFSPDGTRIVTGSAGGYFMIRDLATGQQVVAFPHDGSVDDAAISPDGMLLVSTWRDREVNVWDTTSGKRLLLWQRPEPYLHNQYAFYHVWVPHFPGPGRLLLEERRRIHLLRRRGDGFVPVASRRLPDPPLGDHAFGYLQPLEDGGLVYVTGQEDLPLELHPVDFGDPGDARLEGDPGELTEEWAIRLGVKVNEAGEIVPMDR